MQWFFNILVLFLALTVIPYHYPEIFSGEWEDDYEYLPTKLIQLNDEIDETLLTTPIIETTTSIEEHRKSIRKISKKAPNQKSLSATEIYEQAVRSSVYITVEDADGIIYYGSGSIISNDGIIVTNHHVIEDAIKIIATTCDHKHHNVESIIKCDKNLDVAFIKSNIVGRAVDIGNYDEISVGDTTFVLGHPELFLNTFSIGNVAALRNYSEKNEGRQIQFTNPISSGNSGGMMLNKKGQLIGLPTWSLEYEANIAQVQNLNFAVSINDALKIIRD
ncbi:MAG: S1C family serine protease [Coraliomargaritaceae bacterium]